MPGQGKAELGSAEGFGPTLLTAGPAKVEQAALSQSLAILLRLSSTGTHRYMFPCRTAHCFCRARGVPVPNLREPCGMRRDTLCFHVLAVHASCSCIDLTFGFTGPFRPILYRPREV